MFGERGEVVQLLARETGLKILTKLAGARSVGAERGTTTIEVILAVAILGLVAAAFLGAVATGTRVTAAGSEKAVAESLVRSQLEYVRECAYQHEASEYPVDPTLTVPEGWTVPNPAVEPVYATADRLQRVTVTAEHRGQTILSIVVFKTDR